MTRPYGALIVDYGGVLTTSVSASFAQFCLAYGIDPSRFREVIGRAYAGASDETPSPGEAFDDLIPAVETGRITPEEFDRKLAELLSDGLTQPLDPVGVTRRMLEGVAPDDRMIAFVRTARGEGVRIGMISNTWGLEGASDSLADLFDARVLSAREGLRKPGPEIYLLAADRLGMEPGGCVFVDDLPANVEGARSVGMAGVLHRHPDITIPKLEELLDVASGS
jgi:putative hydrolase of the HAD superfamily